MWGLYGEAAEIILTHPNLCDDGHRQLLRKAAIDANLISQERAKNSLYFFEEAEACTRYFVAKYATRFSDLKVMSTAGLKPVVFIKRLRKGLV